MPFEWTPSTSLGGGLNFLAHPAAIRDDEWSWSQGMFPRFGTAEVCREFQQINNGSWLPATNTPIGMVPDLVTGAGRMLLACAHNSTSVVRLFQITNTGTTTEKTVSGTAPTSGNIVMTAFLNSRQLLSFGANSATNYSLATYDGTNFARIAPTMALSASLIAVMANHVVVANRYDGANFLTRGLAVSDAGSYSTWDPDVSNSADAFETWGWGPISALATAGDGGLVGTSERIYQLSGTGGNPPLTMRVAEERGVADSAASQFLVVTPYGVFYDGGGNIFRMGGDAVASKIYGYVRASFASTLRKFLWHQTSPTWGAVIIGGTTAGVTFESFFYTPTMDAWWRRTHSSGPSWHEVTPPTTSTEEAMYWLMDSTGKVWVDKSSGSSAVSGAFLDTKDFSIASPGETDEVAAVKIDWEPLTNATTDAIDVLGYAHNDLSRSVLGGAGMNTDFSSSFTSFGTLTAGQTELPVRMKGKYHRFRLRQNSGRVRLRSLSLYRRRVGMKVRSA